MSNLRIDEANAFLGTYTDPIPVDLIKVLAKRKCVLFAGSGASRHCLARNRDPLPTWKELLKLLINEAEKKNLISTETHQELNLLFQKNEYLIIAQELIELLGEEKVLRLIKKTLDPDGIIPSRLHELLAITPFSFRITTNYDNLLERAYIKVWNRHIERVCLDELERLQSLIKSKSDFVLKLHGDLDKPKTIVLGQKQYQFLLKSSKYSDLLEDIFKNYSVLMLGYGLEDIDIKLTLDRLACTTDSQYQHFLLCARGTKTNIEKKRLAADRNVYTIEYVDYFGFHNHVDTFLEALNIALGRKKHLRRVRLPLRARIEVHYPPYLVKDGLFVWNFLFREGAITLSLEPQLNQLEFLKDQLSKGFMALDYLLFVIDNLNLDKKGEFLSILKKAFKFASSFGVHIIFLVVGTDKRPSFLKNFNAPTFYVKKGFSEKDLILLRSYIAQEFQMGYRQPQFTCRRNKINEE